MSFEDGEDEVIIPKRKLQATVSKPMISQEQLSQLKDKKIEKELTKQRILTGTGQKEETTKPVSVKVAPVKMRSRSRSPPKVTEDTRLEQVRQEYKNLRADLMRFKQEKIGTDLEEHAVRKLTPLQL